MILISLFPKGIIVLMFEMQLIIIDASTPSSLKAVHSRLLECKHHSSVEVDPYSLQTLY